MQHRLPTRIAGIALALALATAVAAASAQAGQQSVFPVVISSGLFGGALGDARYSANAVEFIQCTEIGGGAVCSARDAAGTFVGCSTTSAAILAAVRGISNASYLQVSHSGGTCTAVTVAKSSVVTPQ